MRRLLFVKSRRASFIELDQRLLEERYDVHELYQPGRFSDPRQVVREVLAADVIVGWWASWHTFLPFTLAWLLRKPSLLIVGGFDTAAEPALRYGYQLGGPRAWLSRFTMRRARILMTNSEYTRQEIWRNVGIASQRVRVVHHGVPDAHAVAGQAGPDSGGAPAGGAPAGGSPAGGALAGGSPAAGSPAAGPLAGGSPAAGSPAAGPLAGGSPAGGSPAGGALAGGSPAAGPLAGSSGGKPERPLALTIGIVDRGNLDRKGIRAFVQAAALVPEVAFVVAGKIVGDAGAELERVATGNVRLAGWLEATELEALLQRARVYVQASMHEGFGVAVAEAMLARCVPVTTRAGALPEVVGDTGVLLDDARPETVALGVRQALHLDMGEAARARVLREFPVQRRRAGLFALLDELLAS